MSSRARLIGALAVGLVALQAGHARAHYYTYINGYLVHLYSFGCNAVLRSVPNPDTNPALFKCAATVKEVEVLCYNPTNHDVRPGEAGTQVTLLGQSVIQAGDWDKRKGRASVSAHIDESELINDMYCVNPNWHAQDAIALAVDADLEVYECTGPSTDPCSTTAPTPHSYQSISCTLPPGYGVGTTPPGTLYDCVAQPPVHTK